MALVHSLKMKFCLWAFAVSLILAMSPLHGLMLLKIVTE